MERKETQRKGETVMQRRKQKGENTYGEKEVV